MIEIIFDMSSIIFNDGSYKIRDPLLKVEHHLAASFEARFDALLSSEPLNEFEINPIARKANLLAEVIAELETYLIEYEAILFKLLFVNSGCCTFRK